MSVLDSYTFCPRCGKNLIRSKHFLKCSSCELEVYSNSKPATALILKNSKDEYLLVKRAVDPKKGWWDLPGGFVDDDENFEQCIIREAKEELGIDIGEIEYYGSYYDVYPFQGEIYPTLAVVFIGAIDDNIVITTDDDVASYEFFKLEDLPLDKLAFESMEIILRSLISN
jgi:NAD+ diphosphatase